MFVSYILRSQRDGKFYYGNTSSLDIRLKAHNAGRVRSTKSRRPWILWYYESFPTKREAILRESYYKSLSGYRWLKEKGIIP